MASHYKLVASFNNKYSFLMEQEVNFDNYISTLEQMDYITCIYDDQSSLIKQLETKGIISGKNHLSICYNYKNEKHYLHPLFGYPEMAHVIEKLENYTCVENGKSITYKIIPHSDSFFQNKLMEFYGYLGEEPRVFFSEIFGKDSPKKLEKYIYNYYDGIGKEFDNLEDEYEWRNLKNKIELEFSKYKVFRNYLVYTNLYMEKHPELASNINNNVCSSPRNFDEIGEADCNYEKEEFLTEAEIESACVEGKWYRAPKRF